MKNSKSKKNIRRKARTTGGTKYSNKTTTIKTTTIVTTIKNINSSKQSKTT